MTGNIVLGEKWLTDEEIYTLFADCDIKWTCTRVGNKITHTFVIIETGDMYTTSLTDTTSEEVRICVEPEWGIITFKSVKLTGGGISGASLQEKTVIPSQSDITVVPDSGYMALSRVTVKGDSALAAENIKKDVTVFGVTGSYEGEITTYAEGVSF